MEKLYDIKKFSGDKESSFTLWKDKVYNALYSEGLESYLVKPPKLGGKDFEKCLKEDRRACGFVRSTLSDSIFSRYSQKVCHELFDAIKEDYGTLDAQTVYLHRVKFNNCFKRADEDMRDYFHRLDDLKRLMADGGYEINEADHILQIMAGTQDDFGYYISSVTGNCNFSEIKLKELCDQLIKEDSYRNNLKANSTKIIFSYHLFFKKLIPLQLSSQNRRFH